MKSRTPWLSVHRTSNFSWSGIISWIAMLALIGIAIGGFREWSRPGVRHSPHVFHLLLVLLTVLFLAIVAFAIERIARHILSSRVMETRDRLGMAMSCGKSVGWDSDIRAKRIAWFGDLQGMFGIPAETFAATPEDFYRHIHPDDRTRVADAITESRDEKKPYSTEFRVVRTDGAIRWVSANGRFHYATSGEPERMLGIAVDITDRKRVEEALTRSEEKFSKAFRESPIAVTLTSARDHRYIEINETFQRITGWTRDEVIGRTPFDIDLWCNPAEREQFAKKVLDQRSVRGMEVKFRCKDGSRRVGLGSGELIEVEGEPCILSAIVDITDRKQAERLLRRKESELAEAQKLAHMGSWQWNPQTNRLTWSKELYELHGLDPKQPPPSVDDLAKFFSPESWQRLTEVMTEAARTGSVRDIDAELIRPGGSKRWISARGQAVLDQNGKLISFGGTAQDITERKQIDEKLYQSEQRLRLAVQAGKMFVYEWDPASDIVTRSPEAIDVLGKDEPLQLTRQEILARVNSDRRAFQHSYSNLTIENPASQTTYRFARTDGTTAWMEKSTRGIFDSDGKLVRVVGVVADVTSRKEAELALRESEERFRRLVEHIEDALAVDDREGRILFANDQFVKLFGFTREELPKITFADYVAPEYLKSALDRHNRRMRGEPVLSRYEYEAIRRDGVRIWVDAEIVSIKNQSGEFVGTQKLLRDATERKRAEDLLRDSEGRFRLVANSAPVMIWVSDTEKLCTYFNKQWLEFTGRPLEAELGNGWAEGVHPDDLDKCLQTYTEAFDRRERFEMEYRLRRHDGEYRWVHDIGVPRFTVNRSFAGYIGSSIDVTEQRVAQEALANMGRKLMEAHEEERTWIGRELHDDINQRLSLVAVELESMDSGILILDARSAVAPKASATTHHRNFCGRTGFIASPAFFEAGISRARSRGPELL